MARSIWKGTLCAALAWAGTAYAQQPPPPSAATPARAERLVSIKEEGKPAQQCRVLKTWRTPDGALAYEVQDVASGEKMTIVEAGQPAASEPRARSVMTRIFHWGRSDIAPAGSPPPPEAVVAQETPAPKPATLPAPVKTVADSTPPSDFRKSWGKPEEYVPQGPQEKNLPHADARADDPLKDPRPYSRLPDDLKSTAEHTDATNSSVVTASGTSPAGPEPTSDAKAVSVSARPPQQGVLSRLHSLFHKDEPAHPAPADTPEVVPASALMGGPAGVQSVLAAGGGFGGTQYVPVPVVTVPDRSRPPMPPPANVPQAPNPVVRRPDDYNAFASPMQNRYVVPLADRTAPGVAINAFSAPAKPLPEDSDNPASMMVTNAFGAPGESPMYSGPSAPPQGVYVYGPIAVPAVPGMAPPSPAQVAQMMAAQASGTVPVNYNVPAESDAGHVQELLLMLHHSLFPSHREWAAESLAAMDWHQHPEIVEALLVSAREDPAPSVRADCVRCLQTMRVATVTAVAAFQSLRNDSDVRVRHEADEALVALGLASR